MRTPPEDKYDREELERLNAESWMLEHLKLNPNYTCWGPGEDYMSTKWPPAGGYGPKAECKALEVRPR